MSRVEWSRLSGDEVEAVVAMFISAQFPHAERVTPSQGDGGIDVLVKDATMTRVYQVKKFAAPLTDNQKGQVEKSVDRLVTDPRVADLEVDEWHLVMPWDATLEAKKWLREYVTSKDLPEPIWDGLTRCDEWAATYPHIVDYYLRGGEERVQTAAMKLIRGVGIKNISQTDVASFDIRTLAEDLQEAVTYLRDSDPFYSYALHVEPARAQSAEADVRRTLENVRPGVVFATAWRNAQFTVQVEVYPKNHVALQLHPIETQLQLQPQPDSSELAAAQDFAKFGSPLSLPMGSARVSIAAPGGLGGDFEGVAVSLAPVSQTAEQYAHLQCVLLDQDGREIDSILLQREYSTQGLPTDRGYQGIESRLWDSTGVLECVSRFDVEAQEQTLTFQVHPPIGQLVTEVFPALSFYKDFTSARYLVVAPRFGKDRSDPMELPPSGQMSKFQQLLYELAKSLTLVQKHTALPLHFPELSELGETAVREILKTGALLDGQVLEEKAEAAFLEHSPGDEAEAGPTEVSVLSLNPWKLELPEGEIDLGYLARAFTGSIKERGVRGPEGLVPEGMVVDVWDVKDGKLELRTLTEDEKAWLPTAQR